MFKKNCVEKREIYQMRTVRIRLEYLPVCEDKPEDVYLPEVPPSESLWQKTCENRRLTEENKLLKRWIRILLIALIVISFLAIAL